MQNVSACEVVLGWDRARGVGNTRLHRTVPLHSVSGQCFSEVLPFVVVWLDRSTGQVRGAETWNTCLKTRVCVCVAHTEEL